MINSKIYARFPAYRPSYLTCFTPFRLDKKRGNETRRKACSPVRNRREIRQAVRAVYSNNSLVKILIERSRGDFHRHRLAFCRRALTPAFSLFLSLLSPWRVRISEIAGRGFADCFLGTIPLSPWIVPHPCRGKARAPHPRVRRKSRDGWHNWTSLRFCPPSKLPSHSLPVRLTRITVLTPTLDS